MKKAKINSVLALTLAASVLMSACASSGKKPQRDRDDDDDDRPGFTRPSTEETEPSETVVIPDTTDLSTDAVLAFTDVLASHYDAISAFEDDFHSWRCPSINLMDIDFDGELELIFKYEAEPYILNLAIYDYDSSRGTASAVLDIPVDDELGSWGLSGDVVLLDDGSIVLSNEVGSGGEYELWFESYTAPYAGGVYTVADRWEGYESMPDRSDDCVPESATHNGAQVATDDFYAAQTEYINRIVAPVMPYSGRVYYSDYTVRDIFGRDWNGIPGSVFAQGEYLYLDDYMGRYGVDFGSAFAGSTAEQAYLGVLSVYEDDMLYIENSSSQSFPTCSYCDITGDGQEELFIWYNADSENGVAPYDGEYTYASMRVFTYDAAAGEAVEMFYYKNAVTYAASGLFLDIALQDDGTLVMYLEGGDLEFYFCDYSVYVVEGDSLVFTENYRREDELISFDPEEYEYTYYHSGEEIDESEFDDAGEAFSSAVDTCISIAPWYSEGSDYNGLWGDTLLSTPNTTYSYAEMVSELS